MQEAFESAEEHRRVMEEEMEQERESLNREWTEERRELQSLHKVELDKVIVGNRQLQNELDDFISLAQTKEIELSRQLNDLHNRLQESLEVKDQLLAQSESKARQAELLLNQTVEDFKRERTEHLSNQLELEARHNEMLGISEAQITERIGLLTERDDLRMKIEELELLLKQAAEDFELERKELREQASVLEEKLEDEVENDEDDLIAEREMFTRRIEELEEELDQVSTSIEKDEKTEMRGLNDLVTFTEDNENMRESIYFSGEEQKTPSPENQINDFDESSKQELVCSSPFLDETVMDALDAEHRGPDDILNVYQEYDNDVPATDDDSEDPEQDDQTAPTENISEESENEVVSESQTGDLLPDEEEDAHVSCCSTETGLCSEEGTNSNHTNIPNKKESVSVELQCEAASSLEVFEDEDADEDAADGEKEAACASCDDESKPQDGSGSFSHEDEPGHETVAEPPVLGETGDPGELSLEDPEVKVSPNSHRNKQEDELVSDSDCEHLTTERKDERADCSHDCLQHLEEDGDRENQDTSHQKLQGLYSTSTEENVLLHEKISLLQQKTEILETLLAHNTEKNKTGHQVLEENYSLKVKMVLLMEHVKGLEIKALKMTDVQIRYEDCMCENTKLKEQNCELEKSVWSLETRMNIFHDFQDEHLSLVDEVSRMKEENTRLSGLFGELEQQYETLSAMHPDAAGPSQSPTGEESLEVKVQAVSDLENCCEEFEKQNSKLRRAVTELQDKSQTLDETTQAHR